MEITVLKQLGSLIMEKLGAQDYLWAQGGSAMKLTAEVPTQDRTYTVKFYCNDGNNITTLNITCPECAMYIQEEFLIDPDNLNAMIDVLDDGLYSFNHYFNKLIKEEQNV